MCETSPDVDNRGLKSVLSGVTSSARNPVGTGLKTLTIIDGMEGMNKNPVNPVILSKSPAAYG